MADIAPQTTNEEFRTFFKALSDANRLKIIGLLAGQPYTVEQLAAALNLSPSTVSHHLDRLSDTELVRGYSNVFSLQTDKLEEMARRLLKNEKRVLLAEDMDIEAYDRKVLRDFTTPDGRVKSIPAQTKKYLAILRYIIKAFEPDRRYPEKEVNEIIKRYNEDSASIRRHFIDFKFMARENGEYWRI
jgi:hypothetical protein